MWVVVSTAALLYIAVLPLTIMIKPTVKVKDV
jgi:hypothetical protein